MVGLTLVVQIHGERDQVIKQIDLSVLSPAALEESHKEVGVLRQLTHRHIVAYFEPWIDRIASFGACFVIICAFCALLLGLGWQPVPVLFLVVSKDTFVKSNSLYIVMEYADGEDLASLIRKHKDEEQPLTETHAMTIFSQCLLALQYIHSKRILHRR